MGDFLSVGLCLSDESTSVWRFSPVLGDIVTVIVCLGFGLFWVGTTVLRCALGLPILWETAVVKFWLWSDSSTRCLWVQDAFCDYPGCCVSCLKLRRVAEGRGWLEMEKVNTSLLLLWKPRGEEEEKCDRGRIEGRWWAELWSVDWLLNWSDLWF